MKFIAEQIMTEADGRLYGIQVLLFHNLEQEHYLVTYNADEQKIIVNFVEYDEISKLFGRQIHAWTDLASSPRKKTQKLLKFFKHDSLTGCMLYNANFRELYKTIYGE